MTPEDKIVAAIKTGDTVLHRPSGEKWLVAYADCGIVCPCGWPETIAKESDCQLLDSATEEERIDLLREMAEKHSHDSRWSYARHALGLPLAILLCAFVLPAAPLLTTVPEPPALQYWHTTYIPTDSGVYSLEVYAPALPPLFAQEIVEIGEPPKLADVPEPGTWHLLALGVALFTLAYICLREFRR